jgi:hypothetical protein
MPCTVNISCITGCPTTLGGLGLEGPANNCGCPTNLTGARPIRCCQGNEGPVSSPSFKTRTSPSSPPSNSFTTISTSQPPSQEPTEDGFLCLEKFVDDNLAPLVNLQLDTRCTPRSTSRSSSRSFSCNLSSNLSSSSYLQQRRSVGEQRAAGIILVRSRTTCRYMKRCSKQEVVEASAK